MVKYGRQVIGNVFPDLLSRSVRVSTRHFFGAMTPYGLVSIVWWNVARLAYSLQLFSSLSKYVAV